MTNSIIERAGHSVVPQESAQAHTLIVLVEDRPGSIDRVVGLFRRRRAKMQTLVLGPSSQPNTIRVTVVMNDSEVAVGHVVEQLRKVVDVQQVVNLAANETISRELALVKVTGIADMYNEIIEQAHLFGARVVTVTPETVTVEIAGSEEQVANCVDALQQYGILEIARSGRVAMARGTGA